ncbi:MAG: hypothetical protein IKX89_02820, partial [Firmicutes bacterium]|nr:hypothetical protein [Bacillota bacterium]
MKVFRKFICLFMTAVMVLMLCPARALAEEQEAPETQPVQEDTQATGFPAEGSPLIYNTTDSSKLAGSTSQTDVHGFTQTKDAEEVDSLISDEALERASLMISRMDSFEPVED